MSALLPLSATLATGLLAWHLWRRFTDWEVKQNAAAILANGSADDLRKGFHQRRGWVRFWPWLGCSVLGSLAMSFASLTSFLLSFAALGLLLAGYFARYFTPRLNLARGLPEFHASSDSASWPDAAAWKYARSAAASTQDFADSHMGYLVRGTWFCCRLGAGVLAVGAVLLTVIK